MSILHKPEVAYAVMRALIRDLRLLLRDGRSVPAWAAEALRELAQYADVDQPDIGTTPATVTTESWHQMVSVTEAAKAVGRSPEYVRRLARTGRIRGRRVGARAWVVDLDSLRGVLDRAA